LVENIVRTLSSNECPCASIDVEVEVFQVRGSIYMEIWHAKVLDKAEL
jgi:hypothetical protein